MRGSLVPKSSTGVDAMKVGIGAVLVAFAAFLLIGGWFVAPRERRRLDSMPPGRLRVGAPNYISMALLGVTLAVAGMVLIGAG